MVVFCNPIDNHLLIYFYFILNALYINQALITERIDYIIQHIIFYPVVKYRALYSVYK